MALLTTTSPIHNPATFSVGKVCAEVVPDVWRSYDPIVWSVQTPLGFLGFCHTKTTGQAGKRRQRNIDYKGHCAFCLSSFPCRSAFTALYSVLIHMLGLPLVPEPCGGEVAASTGRHWLGIRLSTVDANLFKGGKNWSFVELECRCVYVYVLYWKLKCCRGKHMQPSVVLMQRCVHILLLGGSNGSWWRSEGLVAWLLHLTQDIE